MDELSEPPPTMDVSRSASPAVFPPSSPVSRRSGRLRPSQRSGPSDHVRQQKSERATRGWRRPTTHRVQTGNDDLHGVGARTSRTKAGPPEIELRGQLDAIVRDSRLASAVEASLLRNVYSMLVDALEHPDVFIPMEGESTHRTLTGEAEGWVRSSLAQEIGAALGITKGNATSLIMDAEALCRALPATLDSLASGTITRRHASTMIRQVTGLDDAEAAVFEEEALSTAQRQSPTQFARAALRIREGMFPESITDRRTEARRERRVDCYGTHDGMGALTLHGPMEVVHSVHTAAMLTARALKAAGDERTLRQIEADAVTDALMIGFTHSAGPPESTSAGPGVGAEGIGADRLGAIRPTVHVTVSAMTLLGNDDRPGHMDGYGPIDPETARILAAQAPSFTRLLTDPESGAVLSVGRRSYAVPADLKRTVRLRDETCIGVGCDRSASTCDLDHRQEWVAGGQTRLENLQALCEQHHQLKHQTRWSVRKVDDGNIEWISPLGRVYPVRHPSNVQFASDDAGTVDQSVVDDGGGKHDRDATPNYEYSSLSSADRPVRGEEEPPF